MCSAPGDRETPEGQRRLTGRRGSLGEGLRLGMPSATQRDLGACDREDRLAHVRISGEVTPGLDRRQPGCFQKLVESFLEERLELTRRPTPCDDVE